MHKKKKAQDVLTYAMLIVVMAVTLVLISQYIARRVMGVYQSTGDAIGGGEIKD